uniref:Methylenetetrahydrofolate reductase n=1 Tax=Macrostomum lignano TaxID=282301 RepID=A0A1I8F9H2_9PLAT
MPENSSSVAKMPAKEKLQQEEQERRSPPTSRQYRPLATRIRRRIEKGRRWFSCEFFPPRKHPGGRCEPRLQVRQLRQGRGRCSATSPGTGRRNPAGDSPTSSTSTEARLVRVLDRAKSLGLKNILALRGDLPEDADGNPGGASAAAIGGPAFASDLVRLIRRRYGSFFCIGVAGYPAGHPGRPPATREDLRRLKEKVDAGGRVHHHAAVLRVGRLPPLRVRLRRVGIDCPIIPGVLPLSKLTVPDSMLRVIEPIRDNDEAIRNLRHRAVHADVPGASGRAPGIHSTRLNPGRGEPSRILREHRALARGSASAVAMATVRNYERCAEAVRTRVLVPAAHQLRAPDAGTGMTIPTAGGAPSFRASKQERLRMWGSEPTSEPDIWRVLRQPPVRETSQPGRCPSHRLPWGDEEPLPSSSESRRGGEGAAAAGRSERARPAGATNPPAAGERRQQRPPGGTAGAAPAASCIQRAYLEFFLPGCRLPALQCGTEQPRWRRVSFHIARPVGNVNLANFSEPIALTWGVFPASEVAQPTVCDGGRLPGLGGTRPSPLWTEEWAPVRGGLAEPPPDRQCRGQPRAITKSDGQAGDTRWRSPARIRRRGLRAPEAEGGWPDFDCATGLFAEMFNGERLQESHRHPASPAAAPESGRSAAMSAAVSLGTTQGADVLVQLLGAELARQQQHAAGVALRTHQAMASWASVQSRWVAHLGELLELWPVCCRALLAEDFIAQPGVADISTKAGTAELYLKHCT